MESTYVIHLKSKVTGFTGHGKPFRMTPEAAAKIIKELNAEYNELIHWLEKLQPWPRSGC